MSVCVCVCGVCVCVCVCERERERVCVSTCVYTWLVSGGSRLWRDGQPERTHWPLQTPAQEVHHHHTATVTYMYIYGHDMISVPE